MRYSDLNRTELNTLMQARLIAGIDKVEGNEFHSLIDGVDGIPFKTHTYIDTAVKNIRDIDGIVKATYCDRITIYKEVSIDNESYILICKLNVVNGKLLSVSKELYDSNMFACSLNKKTISIFFKALDKFFNVALSNVKRPMIDGLDHFEDYFYFLKSLNTLTYVDTYSKFFREEYARMCA